MRFSAQPTDRLRAELIFRAFRLASDREAWVRGLRVDPRGTSGSFVGQELDVRVSYETDYCCGLQVVCMAGISVTGDAWDRSGEGLPGEARPHAKDAERKCGQPSLRGVRDLHRLILPERAGIAE